MYKINLDKKTTKKSFDEDDYLNANPDVAQAVKRGIFQNGFEHFSLFGKSEGRTSRVSLQKFIDKKNKKITKIKKLIKTEEIFSVTQNGALNFLSKELKKEFNIISTSNISSHGYNSEVLEIINKHPYGIILDCGAGRRPTYFSNVINYEIVDYDTTDVVGVGERLPFKDSCFDAVLSIAVLEHVKDPFICAKEISRVLKPGGSLYCAVPFLQPERGYPYHYYNMTKKGLINLFDNFLNIDEAYVHPSQHPIYSLNWILLEWLNNLPNNVKKRFLSLPISELIKNPNELSNEFYCTKLSIKALSVIGSGHILRAHKC